MPDNYKACLFVFIAIVAAHLLCKLVYPTQKSFINQATVGWSVFTFLLFLTPSVPFYFFSSALLLLFLAPKSAPDKLQYYFAMMPLVPLVAQWQITLPGIETFFVLDHLMVLSLVLLIPIYLGRTDFAYDVPQLSFTDKRANKLFKLFIIFLLMTALMDFRGAEITEGVRRLIEKFLGELLLLLVVFRLCRNRKNIDKILFAIVVSGVFIAFVSCIEAATSWLLYNEIDSDFSVWGLDIINITPYYRDGVLRTPTTMTPIPLGFFMGLCLALNYYLSGLNKRGNDEYGGSYLISVVLLAALIFSGSRGAWMMTGLIFILFLVLQNKYRLIRAMAYFGGAVAVMMFPVIIKYLSQRDPYGTFEYRANLFKNAIVVIQDSLLFGSKDFLAHPALLPSLQGQGIIDIVNAYLGIALEYGVPLLILFLFVIGSVVRKLLRLLREVEEAPEMTLLEWQIRLMVAVIIGGFAMIVTVSLVDRITHYLWVSLVLGICIYRYGHRELEVKKHRSEDANGDTRLT